MTEWQPVGSTSGATLIRWSDVETGTVMEGIYRGTVTSAYDPLAVVDTESGTLLLPRPKVLKDKLKDVQEGTLVRIEYRGKVEGKSGFPYHQFEVSIEANINAP